MGSVAHQITLGRHRIGICHPCYKSMPMHTKKKRGARHAQAKCFVLDHPVSRPDKSARMHKNANETRAGAGHSHACSLLHAPTHAAAPEHAFPALRHSFPTAQRRRRQHTRLENTNTQDKEDKAFAQCEARVVVCNASSMPANPRLTPECPPTARTPTVSMRSHVQADPNTIPACKAQFPPRQSPIPTAGTRGSMQPSPVAFVVGGSVHVAQALLPSRHLLLSRVTHTHQLDFSGAVVIWETSETHTLCRTHAHTLSLSLSFSRTHTHTHTHTHTYIM